MVYAPECPAPPIGEVLAKALSGERLEAAEAYPLIRATGTELVAVLQAASTLRDRGKGRTVSYSRKVFIPLTTMCRQKCGYCTFAKPPGHAEAHTMTPDEVLAVARAGAALGCKEALFSLGEKPEERYARARRDLARLGYDATNVYLRDMADLVHRETGLLPHLNPGVLTREEVAMLREVSVSMGIMLESVSTRLLEKGGAHWACPGKAPAERLATMAWAGEQGVAFTTGILIGIGETPEERVDSLLAIRDLHDRYGHIQEVIIQNFRVKPDIPMRNWPEPSALEMARTIATARLLLGPEMNVQAPPNLTPDAYQQYLFAGINDWGGVSPLTKDHINPERPWPKIDELARVTAEAGFELRERLALYPEYLDRPQFVRERFLPAFQRWADETGLVAREATRW